MRTNLNINEFFNDNNLKIDQRHKFPSDNELYELIDKLEQDYWDNLPADMKEHGDTGDFLLNRIHSRFPENESENIECNLRSLFALFFDSSVDPDYIAPPLPIYSDTSDIEPEDDYSSDDY